MMKLNVCYFLCVIFVILNSVIAKNDSSLNKKYVKDDEKDLETAAGHQHGSHHGQHSSHGGGGGHGSHGSGHGHWGIFIL
jgi:hypothetical protein